MCGLLHCHEYCNSRAASSRTAKVVCFRSGAASSRMDSRNPCMESRLLANPAGDASHGFILKPSGVGSSLPFHRVTWWTELSKLWRWNRPCWMNTLIYLTFQSQPRKHAAHWHCTSLFLHGPRIRVEARANTAGTCSYWLEDTVYANNCPTLHTGRSSHCWHFFSWTHSSLWRNSTLASLRQCCRAGNHRQLDSHWIQFWQYAPQEHFAASNDTDAWKRTSARNWETFLQHAIERVKRQEKSLRGTERTLRAVVDTRPSPFFHSVSHSVSLSPFHWLHGRAIASFWIHQFWPILWVLMPSPKTGTEPSRWTFFSRPTPDGSRQVV